MTRELGSTIRSQSKMLESLGHVGANLTDEQLAKEYLNQVETATKATAGNPFVNSLTIDYQKTLANPGLVASQVNDFLGGVLDEAKMIAVVNPQLRNF